MSRQASASRENRHVARKTRLFVASVLLMCLLATGAYLLWPYAAGYSSMESATRHKEEAAATALPAIRLPHMPQGSANATFPSIDWEALTAQNPDVAAWVTVPGTAIDYPVVEAPANDPQFYLTHDINASTSPYGCPYLDSDTVRMGGIDALFPVVYGHHLINGLMFSNFARFADADYAIEHRKILVMTPEENRELEVIGVNVVNADVERLRVTFSDERDLFAYVEDRLRESEVVLPCDLEMPYQRVYCFVTCSYGSSNERTLVYAAQRA